MNCFKNLEKLLKLLKRLVQFFNLAFKISKRLKKKIGNRFKSLIELPEYRTTLSNKSNCNAGFGVIIQL